MIFFKNFKNYYHNIYIYFFFLGGGGGGGKGLVVVGMGMKEVFCYTEL